VNRPRISGRFVCGGKDAIPLKFQRISGVLDHNFRIATHRVFPIPDAVTTWPVHINLNGTWGRYGVPIAVFPFQVGALELLAGIDGESERAGRYIKVHSAYEALVRPRDVSLSAIRHALAHPITSITRPDVRAALTNHFGGLRINLKSYDHQKIVYQSIGRMLIAIDVAMYETFKNRLNELVSE